MAKKKRKTKRKAKAKRPSYATLERQVRRLKGQKQKYHLPESIERERASLLETITNQGNRIQDLLSQIPQ